MGKLLNDLSAGVKKPFQTYTLEHGIERISIKIPLAEVEGFEAAFSKAKKDKPSIMQLLAEFNGSVVSEKA